ncbi:hypothetical protein J0X15_12305 [Roseibium sp. CAU 1637]|uniref:Uncharacterized protein n=1 Tax=Roseibium limicola TaxID=2816037 RepID=A0A939EQ30_9HYPH|nr:hypothetical protein [Roseibium limicola]MBO0346007.1 hypothetical protein [Roseibium limicola]
MTIYSQGTALVRHAETGEVHLIEADLLDFGATGHEKRAMGTETTHLAVVEHPQLGDLVWSIWEYPTGVESARNTNVGPHELLVNIDFGIEQEETDEDDEDYESAEEQDRDHRVEALIEWFFGHYEDPAMRLPYESAEGGYQWIWGGPYDAREVLEDIFPGEDEEIIDAAVEVIEADGLTEWAPVPSDDDFDDSAIEPLGNDDLTDIAHELETLIRDLRDPDSEPAFRLGEDGLIHLARPSDVAVPTEGYPLLDELGAATGDLLNSIAGTNAHTDLRIAAHRYADAINAEAVSISQIYARGVRLANSTEAMQHAIARDDLPPLPSDAEAHLSSVLELHGAYIMAQPEGRELAESSEAFRRTPEETDAMQNAARRFADAVHAAPELFGKDVMNHVTEAAEGIGYGPQPERSNQAAAATFRNLTLSLIKGVSAFTAATIAGQAVIGSIPGGALVGASSESINVAWAFLVANAPIFKAIGGSFGADLTWIAHAANLLERLK